MSVPEHPSNPDQLMAHTLGVCWHSPTSDRWPCTPPPGAEVALSAEERLQKVHNVVIEFEARAEAAKHLSVTTDEGDGVALVEWGRYYGYTSAARLLSEAMS